MSGLSGALLAAVWFGATASFAAQLAGSITAFTQSAALVTTQADDVLERT